MEEESESMTTSNQTVLIARTHVESVIDRSSPYNIIETNTNDNGDNLHIRPIEDENEIMITEQDDNGQKDSISQSSSAASTTDTYMNAVDIINEEQSRKSFPIIRFIY